MGKKKKKAARKMLLRSLNEHIAFSERVKNLPFGTTLTVHEGPNRIRQLLDYQIQGMKPTVKAQPSHFDTFMVTKHPKLLYHEIASGYFIAKGAGGLCGLFLFFGKPLTPTELNHYQQYGYLAKNVKTVAEAAIAIEEYLK